MKLLLFILSFVLCAPAFSASLAPTKAMPVEKVLVLSTATITGTAASGTIKLDTNPGDTDTITLNGTTVTFVAVVPGANEVQIGVDVATTYASLLAFLQASADTQIVKCTYATIATNQLRATYKTLGVAGNSFTLAKSSTHITLSGAALAGGTATQTVSTINTNGLTLVGIQLPAAFTSTTLTFNASIDGSTWQQVYSTTSGTALSYTVAQGRYIAIDPAPFYGVKYLQIKTGSDETAARTLTVSLKGF
ncbi:MAG: hypothetical protein OEW15_11650 [Nitrospirota bacterium]|nr:hypothetical protein [Nitrospirota bacterium]